MSVLLCVVHTSARLLFATLLTFGSLPSLTRYAAALYSDMDSLASTLNNNSVIDNITATVLTLVETVESEVTFLRNTTTELQDQIDALDTDQTNLET